MVHCACIRCGWGCLDIFLSSISSLFYLPPAMVLGKLPVPGRPTILITVGQGPIALAVGAGGGGLDIFTLIYPSFPLSPSLWETARYRLKYCLKGPLNPKPTNQPWETARYRLKYCLKGPSNPKQPTNQSTNISYFLLHLNPWYLQLLISQCKSSGTRKFAISSV